MKNYHVAHQMLIDSAYKLIEIHSKSEWKNELLEKAPPVLWFGNPDTKKPIILTLGANPSDREFLQKDKVHYLTGEKERFRVLRENENFQSIIENALLRDEIIQSYKNYFSKNPYTKWFGKNTEDPYNLEGFLRGFGASFYDNSAESLHACHIDIFPFATKTDFSKIKGLVYREFLNNGWSKTLLLKLFDFFEPKLLIIIGKNNVQTFLEIFKNEVFVEDEINFQSSNGHNTLIKLIKYNFSIVGINLNLGNPRFFSKQEILELGKFVEKMVTM